MPYRATKDKKSNGTKKEKSVKQKQSRPDINHSSKSQELQSKDNNQSTSFVTSSEVKDNNVALSHDNSVSVELMGELLRKKREEMKLTLEDVSKRLRVKVVDIIAAEESRFNDLAKYLYLSGFVRSYANLLHIDKFLIEKHLPMILKNVEDKKKHNFRSDFDDVKISPKKDMVVNYLFASILLFFILLLLVNSKSDKNKLIGSDVIVKNLEQYTKQ